MEIIISKTSEEEIKSFRILFLQEFNNQFIYDKCHYYNWCDNYLFQADGAAVGYGSIWGLNDRNERDAVFEFYLLPSHHKLAPVYFKQLIAVPGVTKIECQSNDWLLTELLYRYGQNINAEAILFEDYIQPNLDIPGTIFRKRVDSDLKLNEDDGPYVLEDNGAIIAHGGLMLNYNFPYSDIYMHVLESHRGKGYGSLIVQELKKLAYEMERVPAARCNIKNMISKATIEKAGLRVCGFILIGDVKTTVDNTKVNQ
jgi:GNAT superfamily N-acetyltransferase